MNSNTIVTIGRQFGSGGHKIGELLAGRLDIPIYDHQLIQMAAEATNISHEDAAMVDETALGKYLSSYALAPANYAAFIQNDAYQGPMSDRIFQSQKEIILKLAEQGPCIFVGRCADYILGDYSNCLNVFLHAYKEDRIQRIMDIYGLDRRHAWDKIKQVDHERKHFYEERTGRKWDSPESYMIMFNVNLLGIEGTVDALEVIYRKWQTR